MILTRRGFLKTVALATASTILSGTIPTETQASVSIPAPAPVDGLSRIENPSAQQIAAYIQKQLEKSLDQFVFELNDSTTREALTEVASEFLEVLKTERAIYDYKVVCDESNNREESVLTLDIYAQPSRTWEFAHVRSMLSAQGVTAT